MKLQIEIVTPTGPVFQDEADEIIIPTVSGEIAVLPNHVSMLSQIAPGELIIKDGSKTQNMAITGGFLEIANNKVSVLADFAVRADDISAAEAEKAKQRAEERLKEKLSERDFALAEGELRKALLELKVVQKRKHLRS